MKHRMDHDKIRLDHLDRLTSDLGPGHEQAPPRREQCVIDRAVLRALVRAVRAALTLQTLRYCSTDVARRALSDFDEALEPFRKEAT